MKKKILILGVGNAQVDIIKFCREAGYEVYACSYKKEGKGLKYADKFEVIDITDKDKIIDYIIKEKIDFLYSVGSDLAMPTISYVAERLNLPCFINYETAYACQNKNIWRNKLGEAFKGNLPYVVGEKLDSFTDWEIFPAMLKPVDSQGQRGVVRVNSFDELKKNLLDTIGYSKSKKAIVEKYIYEDEISVNGYVVNGKLQFFLVSDRIIFDEYPGGLVKEHRIPSKYEEKKEVMEKIKEIVEGTINKLTIINGPVYFQMKIENNEPYLIEVTPRLDGCHMWKLIEKSTDANLLEILLRHLLENEIDLKKFIIDKVEKYTLKFVSQAPETIFTKKNYNLDSFNIVWYYEDDETVKSINGYMEKVGYYIEKGE